MENQMFCYQCQETAGCSGCTRVGVCGKQPDVAAMQDLLVYATKGISAVTTTLRQEGVAIQPAVNHMITLNLFTTITNANFSKEAIIARIQETLSEKDLLLSKLTNKDALPEAALWNGSVEEFDTKAAAVGVLSTENEDIRSLRELITYGLKGLSAYSKHANVLLQDNEEIDAFMQRALVVGILVSLCAALLGVSLVLKRYSMIGDGLSHVGFGSLAIATALGFAPLAFTIPVVVLAAFLLLRMNESSKIKGDAAIGLISSSALAIGVITVSWSSGMNTDVNNYMFGSILAMSDEDVVLSVVLSIVVLILFVLYYNRIFAVTFDETFAKATGVRAEVYNMLLAFLTAITTVLGMRMMGALLISSLLIFPALTSMRLCHTFQSVVICSAVLSVVCFLLGMSLSFFLSSPAGATVVIVNLLAFLIFSAIAGIREHTA